MSNSYFTRINTQGASAFSLAPPAIRPLDTPILNDSPFKFIDTTINLTGGTTNDYFVLGDAIPPGAIITLISANANNTLGVSIELNVGVGQTSTGATSPNVWITLLSGLATTVPGEPSKEFNGGKAIATNYEVVPPSTPGDDIIPMIMIKNPGGADPLLGGNVHVKLIYLCP
jgi:hypothetical protein